MTRHDPADRLLALAVRLLPAARSEWGTAMRAELAHVEPGPERWRFALGCLRAALWQGALLRAVGSLALQCLAVVLALASGITGPLRVLVIALVVVGPPLTWWIGRGAGAFGQSGAARSARLVRHVGSALVTGCLVVSVGFVAANVPKGPDGVDAATVFLAIAVLMLSGYLVAVLAVTSNRSALSAGAMTSGAGFGAGSGVAGFALFPLNQSLALTGPWLTAVYPAALTLVVVGSPATAALLTARRTRDRGQGALAGLCTGGVAALVVFLAGGATIWLRPELVDSAVIAKGPAALPPDAVGVAGSYLLALLVVPAIGLGCGLLGARIGATGRKSLPAAGLAVAVVVCWSLVTSVLHNGNVATFGGVGATSVAFSADGRALITGADGGLSSILWDMTDPARPTRTATVVGGAVFAPDGHTMASRNLLWNLTDPARPTRLTTFAGGNPVVFSRDGNLLATNGLDHDGTTTLWNVTDRTHPVNLGTITAGGTGAFSPDGSVFAAGSVDGPTTTTLWSLGGTSPVRLATVDGGAGNGPVFSPDGTLLATPADNGTVAVWNVANPASPRRIATLTCGGDTRPMAAVVFAPDGRSLVTASQSGPVALWHVADLNRPVTLSSDHVGSTQIGLSDTLTFAAFSPDGHRFATVSGNDLVTEWNVTDPDRPTRTAILTRRTYGAGQVGFTPDLGAVGGTAPDGSETVSLWHLR